MDIYQIVMKLVGPVEPIGDSGADIKRLENLQELTKLIDQLLTEVDEIVRDNKDHYEHSRIIAADHCNKFLDDIGITE